MLKSLILDYSSALPSLKAERPSEEAIIPLGFQTVRTSFLFIFVVNVCMLADGLSSCKNHDVLCHFKKRAVVFLQLRTLASKSFSVL